MIRPYFVSIAVLISTLSPGRLRAEDDIRELKLRDWEPRSMLKTKATIVEKPQFPVIDIHNHLGSGKEHNITARRKIPYRNGRSRSADGRQSRRRVG